MKLKDRTVIVTGAAKGIGKECALRFASAGARVVIADIDECGESLAQELRENGHEAVFVKTDISNAADAYRLKEEALAAFGSVDVLINNAALQIVSDFFHTTTEDFSRVVNVNLVGTFTLCRVMAEVMEPGSTILNMLSVHYEQPRLNKFSYDASKAGLAMLTKEMALALAEHKITVNGISYGGVITPMNAEWYDDPSQMEKARENVPLKWIAKAEEIAEYAYTIIEVFSDNATGSIFTIDGGRRLK